jgi:DNA polymerase-3 subunit epsilon
MKIFWFDCETTGLDAKKNSIIQIGGVIEIGGVIVERLEYFLRPDPHTVIEPRALEVNGKTEKEIMDYPPAVEAICGLKEVLAKYVNRYDREDKFVAAGFNVNFDIDFLREAFLRVHDKYYGSWFFSCPLDTWTMVSFAILYNNLRLPNFKLTTICDYYGIQIPEAHNAVDDVMATRTLYYTIVDQMKENFRTIIINKE